MNEVLPSRKAAAGRVVITMLDSSSSGALRSWLDLRSQLLRTQTADVGGPRRRPAGSSLGVWRMLATNNREVGRGALLHDSGEEAVRAAQAAKDNAEGMQAIVVRGAVPMTHGWVFALDGEPVMMSARWYESGVEAAAAARGARRSLAGVQIGTDRFRTMVRRSTEAAPLA